MKTPTPYETKTMPTHLLRTAMMLALFGLTGPRTAPAVERSDVQVEHDHEQFLTTIRIRTRNGQAAWSDVIRGLARARGNDDSALEGLLPPGRFPVEGARWELIQTGMNLAFKPHVHFAVEPPKSPRGDPHLVVTLDREALLASTRRLKSLFRDSWTRWWPSRERRQFGLEGPDGWGLAAPDRNLVVLVHGFNSRPEQLAALVDAVRDEGFASAGFRYPNDQPIAESAELLAGELRNLAAAHPGRGVSLITHSMGGLVAREAVENPALDPGNVEQLIMVAPPNHGTSLARFSFALEVWEQVDEVRQRNDAGAFYATIEDGLAEAGVDLRPDSVFLGKLNRRDRNPQVRYSIFLGTKGPLTQQDLARLRDKVAEANRRSRWVRFFGAEVHRWLEDLDEVVDGRGDGVVSVRRGKLDGVAAVTVARFDHLSILDPHAGPDEKKVHQAILEQLRKPN